MKESDIYKKKKKEVGREKEIRGTREGVLCRLKVNHISFAWTRYNFPFFEKAFIICQ
jgi:hypothetical protein